MFFFFSLQCGYLNQPNMIQHPISWTDFNMAEIGETLNPPDKYSFKFKAGETPVLLLIYTYCLYIAFNSML